MLRGGTFGGVIGCTGAVLLALAWVAGAAMAAPGAEPREVLVRFAAGAGAGERAEARDAVRARRERTLPLRGLELVRVPAGEPVAAAAARLEREPGVLYAEPNYRSSPDAVPNDPRLSEQWALRTIGAPAAWDMAGLGSRDVIVAVLDGGVEIYHPEIEPNLWTNPGESGAGREDNGADDDGNGYIDDWAGWHFGAHDNVVADFDGHGTAAAGVIGAAGDNGLGISGVSPRVRIMALGGPGSAAEVVEAIAYARRYGATVLNGSFNMGGYSQAVDDAIAATPEILFTFSAGNEAVDVDSVDFRFPCSARAPNALCVAATDAGDQLAGFSNWGARSVDLAAPGVGVLTLAPLDRRVFDEDFTRELDGRWVTGGTGDTWARAQEGFDGRWALSDSPGADYENDVDSWAALAAPLDLSGASGCSAFYGVRNWLADVDLLRLEGSLDGSSWSELARFTGSSGPYESSLRAYEGMAGVRLRFRLTTDSAGQERGAVVDRFNVWCRRPRFRGDEFAFASGTSFAAPQVAGAAAVMRAARPSASTLQVRDALLAGVEPLPSLSGRVASGGRLSLEWALRGRPAAGAGPAVPGPPPGPAVPVVALDRRAPRCSIARVPRQHSRSLLRRGYRVRVRCDEAVRVSGRMVGSRSATLGRIDGVAVRAARARVVSVRVARARARRLLRSRRAVRISVRLVAVDAAGNRRRLAVAARLRRP